jgi:hypothetical protein
MAKDTLLLPAAWVPALIMWPWPAFRLSIRVADWPFLRRSRVQKNRAGRASKQADTNLAAAVKEPGSVEAYVTLIP